MVMDVGVHIVMVHMSMIVRVLGLRTAVLFAYVFVMLPFWSHFHHLIDAVFRINNINNLIIVKLAWRILEVHTLVLPTVLVLVTKVG